MLGLDNREAMQIILAIAVVLILFAIVTSRQENMTNKKLTKLMHGKSTEGYIPIGQANSEGLCAGVNEESLHRSLATGTVLNRRDNYVVINDDNTIEGCCGKPSLEGYCGGRADCTCGTPACKCGAGPGCGCEVAPCGCVGACTCKESGYEFMSSKSTRLPGATNGILSDSAGLRNTMTKLITTEGFNENSLHNTEVDTQKNHTEGYAGVLASGLLSPMPLSQDDAALRMLL